MKVVIPTHRRMPRQATYGNLPPTYRKDAVLVVDQHDYELRGLYYPDACYVVVPEEIKTIAAKRAWIIRNWQLFGDAHIMMFDDDLRFAVRSGDGTKLRQATHEDVCRHLNDLDWLLDSVEDGVVHAGWSMRQGNNNVKEGGWKLNGRMCFSLAYDCEVLVDLESKGKIQLGRINTREDMDLTLQLLKLGYPNHINYDIACDQVSGFAAKGGCSDERTLESSNADAHRLASLHPGLVSVVQKTYEGSLPREEVIVQWKKAYQSALSAEVQP